MDSHIAHYKRGKRFVNLEKDSPAYKYFMDTYGTDDVNEVIAGLLSENNNSSHIDILSWPNIYMYLPKDVAKKYKNEIKL